jgi:hypothetical protein
VQRSLKATISGLALRAGSRNVKDTNASLLCLRVLFTSEADVKVAVSNFCNGEGGKVQTEQMLQSRPHGVYNYTPEECTSNREALGHLDTGGLAIEGIASSNS